MAEDAFSQSIVLLRRPASVVRGEIGRRQLDIESRVFAGTPLCPDGIVVRIFPLFRVVLALHGRF